MGLGGAPGKGGLSDEALMKELGIDPSKPGTGSEEEEILKGLMNAEEEDLSDEALMRQLEAEVPSLSPHEQAQELQKNMASTQAEIKALGKTNKDAALEKLR